MIFLRIQCVFIVFFYVSSLPIDYKMRNDESKGVIFNNGKKSIYDEGKPNDEEKPNDEGTPVNQIQQITENTDQTLNQKQSILTETPFVLQDLLIIKDDRDEESMKKVFDIVDDQVNDVEEKKNLLKKIEEQTSPQLKQRKAEILKNVVQEVANKMFPKSPRNAFQMAENLIRLPSEKIFKTALDWGIITSTKTTNLAPAMKELLNNQVQEPKGISQDLFTIKDDRDEESMRKVFDIVDDQVKDVNERRILLKKIEEQTPPQIQQRKNEIRQKVIQEVAKKVFPLSRENEIHLIENLNKLSPEQIFKTAFHWGIITSKRTEDLGNVNKNTYNIENQNNLRPTMSELLATRDQRSQRSFYTTLSGITYGGYNEENVFNEYTIPELKTHKKGLTEITQEDKTLSQKDFYNRSIESVTEKEFQEKYGNLKSYNSNVPLNKSKSEENIYDGSDVDYS
ncbi:uncharacterized protein LOC124809000 isoform X1 [Hydra vulgaris]|uniref:uncharacterized protein LOC124809000 isoform X1 n=1 Tax=Hydra vulgaris TaxID=6087 RepID=UPI001F5E78B5|nr:uncharacterized protein LOC124809000 [Hydra vulgaris]